MPTKGTRTGMGARCVGHGGSNAPPPRFCEANVKSLNLTIGASPNLDCAPPVLLICPPSFHSHRAPIRHRSNARNDAFFGFSALILRGADFCHVTLITYPQATLTRVKPKPPMRQYNCTMGNKKIYIIGIPQSQTECSLYNSISGATDYCTL